MAAAIRFCFIAFVALWAPSVAVLPPTLLALTPSSAVLGGGAVLGGSATQPWPSFTANSVILTASSPMQQGHVFFAAQVTAPNGFVVTFDAALVVDSNASVPPGIGVACLVHGQQTIAPSLTGGTGWGATR